MDLGVQDLKWLDLPNVLRLLRTVKGKQRKQAKQLRQDENSQQARLDYSRYDCGENATEITTDLSPQELYTLVNEFYAAKVKVTECHNSRYNRSRQ